MKKIQWISITVFVTFCITMTCWGLWGTDIRVPLTGYRSDSVGTLLEASNYVRGGSLHYNVECGAPYAGEYVTGGIGDSSVPMFLIKIIWGITGSVEAAINIHAMINILLLAISMFCVCQKYNIGNFTSMIMGVAYADAAFFLMSCNTVLLIYSLCFYIPLFFDILIGLMINKTNDKTPNIIWKQLIYIILVMTFFGINSAYYAFLALIVLTFVMLYTLFAIKAVDKFMLSLLSIISICAGIGVYTLPIMLANMGFSKWVASMGRKLFPLILLAAIVILLAVGLCMKKILPYITIKRIYILTILLIFITAIAYVFLKKYTNYIGTFDGRTWISVDLGSYRINTNLLPAPNNVSEALNSLTEMLSSVKTSDYNLMGIVSGVGYCYSMLYLFRYRIDRTDKVLHICGLLNLFMTVLSVYGGLETLIAMYLTTGIRNYNRICVLISATSLISCGIMLDKIFAKAFSQANIVRKYLFSASIYVITIICLLVSIPTYFSYSDGLLSYPEYSQRVEEYNEWHELMEYIEGSVSEGAMIFELPLGVDSTIIGDLMNQGRAYELSIPAILSKTTVWSYGGGSKASSWKNALSTNVEEMLLQISSFGFEGIYIDTLMYADDSYTDLLDELETLLGNPYVCNENRRYFFNMTDYNNEVLKECGEDGMKQIRESIEAQYEN